MFRLAHHVRDARRQVNRNAKVALVFSVERPTEYSCLHIAKSPAFVALLGHGLVVPNRQRLAQVADHLSLDLHFYGVIVVASGVRYECRNSRQNTTMGVGAEKRLQGCLMAMLAWNH